MMIRYLDDNTFKGTNFIKKSKSNYICHVVWASNILLFSSMILNPSTALIETNCLGC